MSQGKKLNTVVHVSETIEIDRSVTLIILMIKVKMKLPSLCCG